MEVENLTINASTGADTLSVSGLGGVTDLKNATLNAGGDAGDVLTVTGTSGPDSLSYTPTGTNDGTVTAAASGARVSWCGLG